MPIDPKSVQWDSPAPAAKGIDPSTVQWDSAPEPSKVGAELPGVFDPATYMDAAKQAYSAAVKNASPAMLANPDFGSMVAHGVAERYGVPVSALIAPPDNAPAPYKEGGPAAAAGAFMQGFAKPLAQAAAVPVGLAGGLAGRDAQDALFKTYDRMNAGGAGEADIARNPTAGGLGTLGGSLAGFALAPEAVGAEALPLVGKLAQGGKAAKTLGAALEHALTQAPGALAAGGLPQGSVAAAKTLQDGGTLPQAFGEAATGAALGTTQFLAPVSLEGNLAVRAASGMGIQQAMSQAQQQAQHAIAPNSFAPAKAPDLTDPMTYLGAVLGAVGGRGEVRPLDDPMLGQLKDAAGAPPLRPTGQLQLPAPEITPPAPAAAKPAGPLDPAAAFLANPKAALAALDPVVLHQVAGDAGFNVRPGTAPSTIIDTMLAKGTPFLHSEVLPEYLAALQEHGMPAGTSAAPASEALGTPPAPMPPQDIAQALQAGATVPVDSAGTAYTPQQGIASLSDALAKRAVGGEQLPAPVTTVDRHGNAMTSADFLAKTRAAQAEAEQQQNAVLNRQHLGITPDIERTQAPRWRDAAAKSDEIANRLANEPDDEIVSQRTDDSPPWWLAGQHAADEAELNRQAAPNAQKLQDAIATGPANAPMHPWTPVVTDKSIPYAGGQSKDLSTAFIDKRIPQMMQIAGKNIDVHQAIGLHENIESSLIRNTKSWSPAELDALAQKVGLQSGADFPKQVREKLAKGEALSYVQGHNIATKGENHYVAMTYGIPAAKYQMALKPAIAAALKQGTGASDIPATLDSKPYDNMGESHLLPQHDLEPLRKEIGWDQVDGRLLREPEADGQGGHAPVAGRTTWVGKAGPNGESDFWRMRPAEGGKITEMQAHAALTKHANGEPLTARERRFIDYAQTTAKQYDADYQADLQRFQQERHDMDAAAQAEAQQELREAGVLPEDHDEALTLQQLVDRAYDAGADPRQVLDATFDGSVSDKARALWDLTRQLEQGHADAESRQSPDQAADGQAHEGLSRAGASQPQAVAQAAAAEPSGRVPEQAHQVKGDLFAPATVKDRLRAANQAKDATRNGLTGGREDTGDGGLFDGKRPEQMGMDSVEDQTDTPAFKRWFGDSKVVDANGKPLVVYHGTDADVSAFDAEFQGRSTRATSSKSGFFFTSTPRTAQSYADHAATVAPVQELIDRADKAGERGNWDEYDRLIAEAEALESILHKTPDGRMRGQNIVPTYLSIQNPLEIDADGENPSGIGGIDPLIRRAKALGHDGVIIRNLDDAAGLYDEPADHFIAFEPTQIKSATGNRGTFDPSKPSILDDAEVTEHSLTDDTPEARDAMRALQRDRQSRDVRDMESALAEQARQESRDQGERDATDMGLRDSVSKALEGLGGHLKVEFVRDEMGLPEGSSLRPLPKGLRRLGTFMPSTGRVFIFTGSRPSMAEAAFTAAHEVYGHRAIRLLAEAHPDVKVGTLTAPEALNKALDMALQNPTVAKVAESMSKQRGSTDRRLLAEEALADLSAAKQTGNWDKIQTKHGVDVPEAMRNGVKGAIANFIERMRRLLNALISKITGKPADFTDAQVHEFMQDAADQLHGDEAAPSKDGGQALDAVDHEAVSQTHLSIPMVKEALRNRGVSEDVIAGMSRAELRAEQSALRARSEPTPEQADTGVKNATKEEERVMKGKAAVEHDLSTSNPAQYATAKARFDADPHAGQILAAKVISEKKSITPEDSILLSLDAMRIINARQSAYEQAEQAMGRGDEATRTAALSLVRQLDGQMEANDIAARYSGVRAGQALQARKVMIAQDYSMARLVLRAKVAKGEALTDAERAKVEKAADAIAHRTKELDAREAKLRAMEAEARPVAQKRAAKAKFEDLVAELKAIAQKDHMNPGCVV